MPTQLRGLSSKATQHLLVDLAAELERGGGAVVRFESAGGVDVARRVRDGEAADVLVLAEDAMAALADDGLLVAGTLRPLFVSDVVLAVPSHAPVPGLSTEDELADTLRAARRIAYSTGPSGTALLGRLDELGLTDELGDRLVQAPAGTPVGSLLADGKADVGVQQRSELSDLPGVRVVGPLPGRTAVTSTFSGAVPAASAQPDAAVRALAFLASDEARDLVERHGMQAASP
jgi:molybdate transport system substrate-binding protein